METLPEAKNIRAMHSKDLTLPKRKLAYFGIQWGEGPKLYKTDFGDLDICAFHNQFKISDRDASAWMLCMKKAIEEQDYTKEFKIYLIDQYQQSADFILRANKKKTLKMTTADTVIP